MTTQLMLEPVDDTRTINSQLASVSRLMKRLAQSDTSDVGQLIHSISDALLALRSVSHHAELTQLTYFLEMALYEARHQACAEAGRPQPEPLKQTS